MTIEINHEDINSYHQTQDMSENVIRWDPVTALVVRDEDGEVIGVESPAMNLLHEAVHATDENFIENSQSKNDAWLNDAERLATQTTNAAADEAGEVQRVNYGGELIFAPNPTEHSEAISEEEGLWVQMDYEGDIEVDEFTFEYEDMKYDQIPEFGDGGTWRGGGDDDDTVYPWIGGGETQRIPTADLGGADQILLIGLSVPWGADQVMSV